MGSTSGATRTVLRGARIVDGTGAPARPGSVAFAGDRIVAVGEVDDRPDDEVVDLEGLVVAPGFIDIHTHYDAQILWDPDLTPSSWHGVTTVVMGNCGFGIAPTRREHRSTIVRTLENVEGMDAEALEAGVRWAFETFPEYLDGLDRSDKRLNVGAMLGHTPLRLYVLGEDRAGEAANVAEIAEMRAIVVDAVDAGALGFATSRASQHVGDRGRPVPSRGAENGEIFELATVLSDRDRGVVQATAGPGLFVEELAELSEHSRRPVTWTALLTGYGSGANTARMTLERQARLGGEVWPQVSCKPLVMQANLKDPFPFASLPSFREILARPRAERAELYARADWRERARPELSKHFASKWPVMTVQESKVHAGLLNGPSILDLATESGADPVDVLLDLALEDSLETRFRIVLANSDEDELGELLQDERTILGLSDAGAHAQQLCDADFATHLLSHWHRDKGVLTLEAAVWRLTGQPASVFGIADRGVLRPGMFADIVAFDQQRVGSEGVQRVWDQPAGADRLVARSTGIPWVWVNGQPIRRGGVDDAAARPGVLVR